MKMKMKVKNKNILGAKALKFICAIASVVFFGFSILTVSTFPILTGFGMFAGSFFASLAWLLGKYIDNEKRIK